MWSCFTLEGSRCQGYVGVDLFGVISCRWLPLTTVSAKRPLSPGDQESNMGVAQNLKAGVTQVLGLFPSKGPKHGFTFLSHSHMTIEGKPLRDRPKFFFCHGRCRDWHPSEPGASLAFALSVWPTTSRMTLLFDLFGCL